MIGWLKKTISGQIKTEMATERKVFLNEMKKQFTEEREHVTKQIKETVEKESERKEKQVKESKITKAKQLKDDILREKELATIENEAWVKVVTIDFADPKNPKYGFFELDWNHLFIESLIEAGYSGSTDEEIIDQWFNDLCRGIIEDSEKPE